MAGTRKKYDKEFKEEAVKMVLEGEMSKVEVGRRLGVHSTSIGNWVRDYQAKGSEAFPGNGKLSPRDEEVRKINGDGGVVFPHGKNPTY